MLMSSWAVTNFLLILPILLNVSDTGINLIATWNIIGSVLVPSLFILFIDSFEGQVEATKVGVATATIGAAIFIAISGLFNDIAISSTIVVVGDLTTMRWSPITSLAIFPTVLLAGYWTQKELIKSSKHAFDPRQILQIKIMRIGGVFMFFIGPLFGIIGVVLVDGLDEPELGTWASEIVGYLLVSVGIFLITVAYTRSREIAFLQPQKLNTLLLIYETGIPILQYDFNPNEKMNTELPLISGAITAITAIMGEAFKVSTQVKQIGFYEKEILLEFRGLVNSGETIGLILITDKKSSYLESAIQRYADTIVEKYGKTLAEGMGISEEQKIEAKNDLLIAFGYSAN